MERKSYEKLVIENAEKAMASIGKILKITNYKSLEKDLNDLLSNEEYVFDTKFIDMANTMINSEHYESNTHKGADMSADKILLFIDGDVENKSYIKMVSCDDYNLFDALHYICNYYSQSFDDYLGLTEEYWEEYEKSKEIN